MTISAISAASGNSTSAAAAAPKQEMDSDVFMKLFITQLKNQDPSSPMDSTEMVAQTAQLSMMESLTNLNTTSNETFAMQMRATAASLIGKEVTYINSDGTDVTGIAETVSFKGTVPVVTVGGVQVPLDEVAGITA